MQAPPTHHAATHSPPLLALALALAFTYAASGCDSPGGGSGLVNCDVLPSSPICGGGGSDTTGGDTATRPPADTLTPNDTLPPDTADTAGPADTSPAGPCLDGDRRCDGALAQLCTAQVWTDLFTCPADKECEAGFCVDPGSDCTCVGKDCGDDGCGNLCGTCTGGEVCEGNQCIAQTVCDCGGATCGFDNCGNSCGTCTGGMVCQAGQCTPDTTCTCNGATCGFDNCGNSCGTCGAGTACQGGQCVSTGGSATCTEIIDCIYTAGGCVDLPQSQQPACQDACVAEGDAVAQAALNAYVQCANTCGDDATCFWTQCSDDQAACFFEHTGSAGCWAILECMDTCNNSDTCITNCYEQSTRSAQSDLLALNGCINQACPSGSANDCVQTAANGVCASYLAQCQAN